TLFRSIPINDQKIIIPFTNRLKIILKTILRSDLKKLQKTHESAERICPNFIMTLIYYYLPVLMKVYLIRQCRLMNSVYPCLVLIMLLLKTEKHLNLKT